MINRIPRGLPDLIGAANVARSAADDHGATIPLTVNTAENLGLEADALTTARDNHEAGLVALVNARNALLTVVVAVRLFLTLGRDIAKTRFGSKHSEAYRVLGFSGSLIVPENVEKLIAMLQSYKAYYTANPLFEVTGQNQTAANAQALLTQLIAARANVNQKEADTRALRVARDAAATTLRKRISGLIAELKMRMSGLDARWLSFGFNQPGASAIPAVPEHVIATLINNNSVTLKWNRAARADYYRVWKKVNGVDQELITVGSPNDVDFLLDGLPANATIELAITAVNNGGESQLSQTVTIITH